MRPIGFSTGAVAKADYRRAIAELLRSQVRVIELSALRRWELPLLVADFEHLQLRDFDFVSFHAPSRFQAVEERAVVEELDRIAALGVPIVAHPDVIFTVSEWKHFGPLLFIENMDKRKRTGRTARDLTTLFDAFPTARMCFDLGHARQVDPTMLEARLILEQHRDRLAEVHISEVNTASRHDPISEYAVKAADLGIQIMGGMGYSAETDMQRYWRDHRILRITPISNEMVRNSIAESLGLPRSY